MMKEMPLQQGRYLLVVKMQVFALALAFAVFSMQLEQQELVVFQL